MTEFSTTSQLRTTRKTIALVTDFGLKSTYVGVIKGVIAKINPLANVVDLCHHVTPQDVLEAYFLLRNSYSYFPAGTIFVVVVDPGVGSARKLVCLKTAKYHFLAPDNGVLGFVPKGEDLELAVEVSNEKYRLPEISQTFQGRDILSPAAAYLCLGVDAHDLGRPWPNFQRLEIPQARRLSDEKLEGEVMYADAFGNLITNLEREAIQRFLAGRPLLSLQVHCAGRTIEKPSRSYSDCTVGELLALFGSSGQLEISVNRGSAERELGVSKRAKVVLECREPVPARPVETAE